MCGSLAVLCCELSEFHQNERTNERRMITQCTNKSLHDLKRGGAEEDERGRPRLMHMLLWQLKGLSTALPPSLSPSLPHPQEAMAVAALRALASLPRPSSTRRRRRRRRRTGAEGKEGRRSRRQNNQLQQHTSTHHTTSTTRQSGSQAGRQRQPASAHPLLSLPTA